MSRWSSIGSIKPGESGNYALGTKDDSGEFIPKYVGRSDTDLWAEFVSKLGKVPYPFFKFSISSPRNAYELECAQFHGFQAQIDNKTHPTPPVGSALTCFLCGL